MNIGKIDRQMHVVEDQGSILIYDAHDEVDLIPMFAPSEPVPDIEPTINELKQEAQPAVPSRVHDYLFTVVPALLLVITNFYFSRQGSSVNSESVYWLQTLITAGAAMIGLRRKSSMTTLIWLGALFSMLTAPMIPALFNNGFSADWMNTIAQIALVPISFLFGRSLWRNRGDFLKIGVGLLPIVTMLTSILTASAILRHGLLDLGASSANYLILDVFNTLLSYGLLFLGRKRRTRWAGLFTAIIYNVAFYASLTSAPLSAEMLPVWLAWVTPVGLGFLIDRWWQKRKRIVTH